jgi:elongator complex protein 5
MAPTTIQHRRTHNILLISKLLNQRDASSPFTLVLDNLEQSGQPVLAEYSQRANVWIHIANRSHKVHAY